MTTTLPVKMVDGLEDILQSTNVKVEELLFLVNAEEANLSTFTSIASTNIPSTVKTIHVLGRNSPNDGGKATYRLVQTEPSHVLKARSLDGAWWEIDEKILTFDHFGVDKTGTDVADQGIKDCFDTAYAIGARVEQHHGIYLWRHQQINVLVDADLTGCVIKTDATSGALPSTWSPEIIFAIQPTTGRKRNINTEEIAELNSVKSSMLSGCTYLNTPLVASRRDAQIGIFTQDTDILRSTGVPEYIIDFIVTGFNGELTVGFDRSFNSATVTGGYIYERETSIRTFKCPTFVCEASGSVVCIRNYRSETQIHNFQFIETVRPAGDMIRQLVQCIECDNVDWFRGSSECPDQPTASYTIAGWRGTRVRWHNWKSLDGWGATGLNHIKYWSWFDSVLNRVDVHWGGRRYNECVRCLFPRGRASVSGSGIWKFIDCEWVFGTAAGYAETPVFNECFVPRADYGYEFDGTIEIIRPIITVSREVPDGGIISIVKAGGALSYDPGRSVILPSVVIKDVTVRLADNLGAVTQGFNIVAVNLEEARFVGISNRFMYYPEHIEVDGVVYTGQGNNSTVHFSVIRCNYHGDASVRVRRNSFQTSAGVTLPLENSKVIGRNIYDLYKDRNIYNSNDRRFTLDFRQSVSNWSTDYINNSIDCYYPDIQLINCRKASAVLAIKGRTSITNTETVFLSDNWGGNSGIPVYVNGGLFRPMRQSSASVNPALNPTNMVMLGVSVYSCVNDTGSGFTPYSLGNAKGAGNFLINGVKGTDVNSWDANYLNFWAV